MVTSTIGAQVPRQAYDHLCKEIVKETDQLVKQLVPEEESILYRLSTVGSAACHMLGNVPYERVDGFSKNPLLDREESTAYVNSFINALNPIEFASYLNTTTLFGTALLIAAFVIGTVPFSAVLAAKTVAGFKLTAILAGFVGHAAIIVLAANALSVRAQNIEAEKRSLFDVHQASRHFAQAFAVRTCIAKISRALTQGSGTLIPIIATLEGDLDVDYKEVATMYTDRFDPLDKRFGLKVLHRMGRDLLSAAEAVESQSA